MRTRVKANPREKGERTPPRRWRSWLTLALILAVIAWAGHRLWRREPTPELPSISTAGLDRTIAALVTQAENDIRSAPKSGAAWGKLGMILQGADLKTEARNCFSNAEKFEPKEPRWPYFYGLLVEEEPERA